MARSNERTPLLREASATKATSEKPRGVLSPANRILFAGFLVSLTLGLTQASIIYVFRVMSCDAYYETHPPFDGPEARRCFRPEIDSSTATQVSILGMTTSICGIINLFGCGALIKRIGTRWGFVSQTGMLAIRVAFQALSVVVGGRSGIAWMQATQLIGIIGGPRGYMLVLNTAVAEVVPRREHTGVFGRLQGALMMGTAIGYLLGGILGDTCGIQSPFMTASGCFIISTIYGGFFMPNPSTEEASDSADKAPKAASGFFAPIKVLMPQHFRLESGKIVKHWGLVFLAFGVFFGVFATGYAPILIQMYATSRFGFGTTENGILMSGNAWIRGLFLMFMFPKIIDAGRRRFAATQQDSYHPVASGPDAEEESLPPATDGVAPVPGLMNSEEPTKPPNISEDDEEDEDSTFDLSFLRWSLVLDGFVTSISAWATQGWHMYLAAFLLPFASGSAPAAKGVITEMCPPHLRQDALSAITLVESAATLSTQGLFGFIYASLSAIGRANLTFFCNGGLAMIAVAILALARYPPYNSTRVEPDERDHRESDASPDTRSGTGSR